MLSAVLAEQKPSRAGLPFRSASEQGHLVREITRLVQEARAQSKQKSAINS
jgi:hypothetical protein